jgi:hypothetical protein
MVTPAKLKLNNPIASGAAVSQRMPVTEVLGRQLLVK